MYYPKGDSQKPLNKVFVVSVVSVVSLWFDYGF